jgi:hypothetical protein
MYLAMWASLASVQLEMMMRRGWRSTPVLEAAEGRYKETRGLSFFMKERGFAAVAGAAAADVMVR